MAFTFPFFLPLILLLLFLHVFPTSSYIYDPRIQTTATGRTIWDLYDALTTDVQGNAQDWEVGNTGASVSSRVFTCKNSAYVGRSGVVLKSTDYMKRRYTGLPTHTMIYYSINLISVDNWSSPDTFSVIFDNRVISTWAPDDYVNSYGEKLCGNSDKKEVRMTVAGKLAHSASDLTLKISLNIQSSNRVIGFGVQHVSLYFPTSTSVVAEETKICPNDKCLYSSSKTCDHDKYLDGSSCKGCDSACEYCYGPNSNQCFQCKKEYSYNGANCVQCKNDCILCENSSTCDRCKAGKALDTDGSCKGSCSGSTSIVAGIGNIKFCVAPCTTGQFMLPDYTCTSTCNLPMVTRTTGGKSYCDFPCDQSQGLYLYWNGSCLPTCPYAPRVTSYGTFCEACNPISDYLYQNGTCLAGCTGAYTPSSKNGSNFCASSCVSPNFLYQNGSCIGTCQALFHTVNDGTFKYCNYPCQSGEYLYENGTCLATCQPGFLSRTENSYQFCWFPCTDLNKFLNEAGTCQVNCPSPWIQRQENLYKFCTKPCPSISDFLYENDTCSSYCEQYFTQPNQNGISLCNFPCTNPSLKYLYSNGSCLGDCTFPYRTVSISGSKYCYSPCSASEYLYSNGSCLSDCFSPMVSSTIDSYKFCKDAPPPSTAVEEQVNKTAEVLNSGGKAAGAGMAALSVMSPSNPSSTTAATIKQMLEYLRYLNISRSDKLEGIFNVSGSDAADFIPDPEVLENVKDNLVDQPLPYMFKKYRVHSSFIINLGDKIVLLLILSTAMGILIFLDYSGKWIRNAPILRSLIKKLRVILQNFVLGNFLEQYGQIIFYASLDMTSYSRTSGFATLSLAIGVCCIAMGIPLIFLSFWIVKKYQTVKTRPALDHEETEKRLKFFEEKYKGIGLLFEDFNDKSFHQQAFLFYSVLRSCLFNLIVVFLYLSPMAQILIILGLNVCMMVYILHKRPLKSWVELTQQICFEITVFVVNIGFLIMAIIERTENKYLNVREKCSDIVIIFNIIYTFLPLGFLGLRTIVSGWEMFSFVRGMYLKSKGYRKAEDTGTGTKHSTPELIHRKGSAQMTAANTSELNLINLDSSHIINDSHSEIYTHGHGSGSGPGPGPGPGYKKSIYDFNANSLIQNNSAEASRMTTPMRNTPMKPNENILRLPSNGSGSTASPLYTRQGSMDNGAYQINVMSRRGSSRFSENTPVSRQGLSNQVRPRFSNPQQGGLLQVPISPFGGMNNNYNSQGNNELNLNLRSQQQQQQNNGMDYERGDHGRVQLNSPQGPIANAIKLKRKIRMHKGKIKMPS